MFSTGRIIFTLILLSGFVVLMFYAYKKDAKNQQGYGKDALKVLAVIVAVILIYLFFTRLLK